MKQIIFPCLLTLIILTTGCGGPKYVPDITLTTTGPIIDAIAEFHNLLSYTQVKPHVLICPHAM